MRSTVFFAALIAALIVSGNSAPAAYSLELQPLMKPVNAVLAAMDKNDPGQLAGAYSSDAAIVDDQAPYRWSGKGAPNAWLSAVATKLHDASFTASGDPMAVMHGTDAAYVVLLGTLRGTGARTGLNQRAMMTFSLRKAGAAWKITNQSWTALPPSKAV